MKRHLIVGLAALVVAVTGLALLLGPRVTSSDGGAGDVRQAPAPAVDRSATTRILAAGDTGTGPGTAIEGTVERMVEEAGDRGYDGLVLLGDLIYPEGDADVAPSYITDIFEPVTSLGARLVPVLGNHDYLSDEESEILAGSGQDHPWYVERIGIVRVVVLDTELVADPEQTDWLRETLSTPTDADWTVVAMHKPAYSAGSHGSDPDVQREWVPLFEEAGVPLVLAGHDHDYQRSVPIDGVTYVVSGGAATLRATGQEDFTEVSASTLHYLDLVFEPDGATVRAVDQDGLLVDSFELGR